MKHELDLTKDGSGGVPKKSYLNKLARSIGKDWFDKIIFLVAILVDLLVSWFFEISTCSLLIGLRGKPCGIERACVVGSNGLLGTRTQ